MDRPTHEPLTPEQAKAALLEPEPASETPGGRAADWFRRNPWAAIGAAAALGVLCARSRRARRLMVPVATALIRRTVA